MSASPAFSFTFSAAAPAVLAADLLLGRDEYSARYIRAFRQRQKAIEEQAAQSG